MVDGERQCYRGLRMVCHAIGVNDRWWLVMVGEGLLLLGDGDLWWLLIVIQWCLIVNGELWWMAVNDGLGKVYWGWTFKHMVVEDEVPPLWFVIWNPNQLVTLTPKWSLHVAEQLSTSHCRILCSKIHRGLILIDSWSLSITNMSSTVRSWWNLVWIPWASGKPKRCQANEQSSMMCNPTIMEEVTNRLWIIVQDSRKDSLSLTRISIDSIGVTPMIDTSFQQ